ncbi:MAG: ABC transporter ATP-binding protein [Gammaproteobacteria bacterium]|nr:ABC transporter ATP-binding protein [Gammaproteobacteria bacterium]
MSSSIPLLEMRGIEKRFGDVCANKSVDLTLHSGEVLGLLGENGAGKTTLMNVLFGMYSADAGTVRVAGSAVSIDCPADAIAAGVGMVHQHFHLVLRHTVLENLLVGQPSLHGRLNKANVRRRLDEIGERYGLTLPAESVAGELSVGEQQRLEIVKALFRGARVLILDEPTSVLTPQQTEGLFEAMRAMAKEGVGIIFISHKLGEVLDITDRLTIMRRGEVVATLDNDGALSRRQLAELMCGHELEPPRKASAQKGAVLLELKSVGLRGHTGVRERLADVSLAVRGGEIVGMAGVSGNGQKELAEVIAGVIRPERGQVEINGYAVRNANPRMMRRLGLAYIPEDRIGAGLLPSLSLSDSMMLPRFNQHPFSRFGWLNRTAIQDFVREQVKQYGIRVSRHDVRTGTLSGGNLQKALLARELAFHPLVVVAAQPTRGLDVGAVEFVHSRFLELRSQGRAVLLISEDLEELFALSDRILVLYAGRVVGNLCTNGTSVSEVGLLMTGSAAEAV